MSSGRARRRGLALFGLVAPLFMGMSCHRAEVELGSVLGDAGSGAGPGGTTSGGSAGVGVSAAGQRDDGAAAQGGAAGEATAGAAGAA